MKKSLIVIGVSLLGTVLLNNGCKPSPEKKMEQVQPAPPVNEFPNMMLSLADGTKQNAKSLGGRSILIIYFTGCDHCQREATEIRQKLEAFEKYDLWFLSTDPFPSIDKFAVDYKLNDKPNVHFAQIKYEDIATYFGAIPTPSVYVYSQSKKLVRAINGETPVDMIIQFL